MIPIKNIYYMLAYAYKSLHFIGIKEAALESFDNAIQLYTELLIIGLEKQIKRGLHRVYLERVEEDSIPRGKILIENSLNLFASGRRQLVCSYPNYSENAYLNQILHTTLRYVNRADIKISQRKKIKQLLRYFRRIKVLNPKEIEWEQVYDRKTQSYKALVTIAYLILHEMLQQEGSGRRRVLNFMDDQSLSRLYEKFLLEYSKQAFPKLNIGSEYIRWDLNGGNGAGLPAMKTDLTIRSKDKILIIDAKYYGKNMQTYFNKNTLHSANLYQIFAYVKNCEASSNCETAGLLLYAKTDNKEQPNFTYRLNGSVIMAKALDLDTDFENIKKQIHAIVGSYFEL